MENPISDLFEEVSKIANFRQLLRDSEFLSNLERLDNNSQMKLREYIRYYFKCHSCKNPQIRFEDGGRICFICNYASYSYESKLNEIRDHYECLKCFKIFSKDFFNCCRDKHLCGYCVSKEVAKGRTQCRICNQNFINTEARLTCGFCNQIFPAKNVFQLRCGCKYCKNCFTNGAKKKNRCERCPGINITASEIYDFTTREQEMCIICETNQPIISRKENGEEAEGEFFRRKCCFLDICKACTKRSNIPYTQCLGCNRNSLN